MKRSIGINIIFMLAALLMVTFAGVYYLTHQAKDFPFRCSAFSRYDLSRNDDKRIEFAVAQDLRFDKKDSGYLLLNGQATSNDGVTILNRRVALINGAKISDDTYRYQISKVVTSNTDTTPDVIFNKLLAEITLDPTHLQLDVDMIDKNTYIIGGPISYLFTCQRY